MTNRMESLTPITSFIAVLVFGIVLAVYIVPDESMRLPIILLSFFAGILIAAMEMRVIVRRSRTLEMIGTKSKLQDEEVKQKLARFVADLFDEDIPFDDDDDKSDFEPNAAVKEPKH